VFVLRGNRVEGYDEVMAVRLVGRIQLLWVLGRLLAAYVRTNWSSHDKPCYYLLDHVMVPSFNLLRDLFVTDVYGPQQHVQYFLFQK
jgi:hypothetical protein